MRKMNLLLFLLPIFILFSLNLLLPKEGEAVSKLEKRMLKPFPVFSMSHLWSGQYFREFDNYFADHFVFRDTLVQVGSQIKDFRGLPGEEQASIVVQKGGNNMFQDRVKDGSVAPPPSVADGAGTPDKGEGTHSSATSTPAPAAEADNTGVKNTESERYLVLKDRAMTLYTYVPAAAQSLTKGINEFRQNIDPKIKIYSMLAPSAVEFINEPKYKGLSSSQKETISQVNRMYSSNVIGVDAHKELSKHTDEYIYFRTDHHWTALGAYYAYRAFMEQAGMTPVPLSKYENTEQLKGYLGSAYSATLDNNLKKNPDTITIYKPYVPYKYNLHWSNDVPLERNVVDISYGEGEGGGYAVFLGGDSPWGEITTENKNGKKLLVIKDSYGSPVIPFLLPHYEQVYFIDLRYFDMRILDFVKSKEITEILFINGISTTIYEGYAEMLLDKQ